MQPLCQTKDAVPSLPLNNGAPQRLPWGAEGGGGVERTALGAESAGYIQQYLGLGTAKGFWYIRRVGLGVESMALRPLCKLQLGDGRLHCGGVDGGSRRGEEGREEAKQPQSKVMD